MARLKSDKSMVITSSFTSNDMHELTSVTGPCTTYAWFSYSLCRAQDYQKLMCKQICTRLVAEVSDNRAANLL